jgi:hypothetical protein
MEGLEDEGLEKSLHQFIVARCTRQDNQQQSEEQPQ